MRCLHAVLLTLISTLMFVRPASADEATQRQAAEELVRLVHAENLLEGWRQRLNGQAVELVADVLKGRQETELTPEQREVLRQFSQQAQTAVAGTLDWTKLRDGVASVYQARFTEGELRELVEFYRSPVGQKWADRSPGLINEADGVIGRQVQAAVPEFKRLGREMREKYAAAGPSDGPPAASAPEPGLPAFNPKTGMR